MKGVDVSVCPIEIASARFVCLVIHTFCSYSLEPVAAVYLNLSNITAGSFKGISPKTVFVHIVWSLYHISCILMATCGLYIAAVCPQSSHRLFYFHCSLPCC